jgi:hypothetical protein
MRLCASWQERISVDTLAPSLLAVLAFAGTLVVARVVWPMLVQSWC